MKWGIATSSKTTGRVKSIRPRSPEWARMAAGSRRSASTMPVVPLPVSSAFAWTLTIGS